MPTWRIGGCSSCSRPSQPRRPAPAIQPASSSNSRYTDNIATLARQLQQAVDAGDVAPLSPAEIDVEVRLVTAVLDGIGLQWLLDPTTDVVASISNLHQPNRGGLA